MAILSGCETESAQSGCIGVAFSFICEMQGDTYYAA